MPSFVGTVCKTALTFERKFSTYLGWRVLDNYKEDSDFQLYNSARNSIIELTKKNIPAQELNMSCPHSHGIVNFRIAPKSEEKPVNLEEVWEKVA